MKEEIKALIEILEQGYDEKLCDAIDTARCCPDTTCNKCVFFDDKSTSDLIDWLEEKNS